jgi:hypothetical protein
LKLRELRFQGLQLPVFRLVQPSNRYWNSAAGAARPLQFRVNQQPRLLGACLR